MPHATIPSDEFLFAEDALISNAQFVVHNLMANRGMTRADLARKLGVSDARVSQMFSDSAPNLTLKTLAHIFCVLGEECRITSDGWEAILAKGADCAEVGSDAAPDEMLVAPSPRRQPAMDIAAIFDLTNTLSIRSYESESSNDNYFQREAVAA
jgi:transcriptional regulator with XRE-family HTH domain